MGRFTSIAASAALMAVASAQTFQRLGTCPTLGCILPPDQADFLPGQYFDLRFEVHAPVNGSEAFNNGVPDEKFSVTIQKEGGQPRPITDYFKIEDAALEKWNFTWFEDLFAKDANKPSLVNVASKIYRKIALYEPGNYEVKLNYYGEKQTVANWVVRPLATKRKAKNVILFIGTSLQSHITSLRTLTNSLAR